MSDVSKTVTSTTSLDLFSEQAKDVENMRRSLLSFDKTDANAARKAIQNITLLRVYHQLERIVRYTEMIDKLEDRIYQSIDMKLANSDPDDEELYYSLIPIQERLQKMMIESHKLLEPYLEMEQLAALEVPQEADPANSFTSMLLEQESREKVRTGVQQLMSIINTFDTTSTEVILEQKETVQSKAQEALSKLSSNESELSSNESEYQSKGESADA